MNLKLRTIPFILACCILFLIFLKSPAQTAAETVTITHPTFNVTMNEMNIDSTYRTYPFIVYKDITYFPMTWHDSRLLGLETNWSAQSGLDVTQTGIVMNPNDYKVEIQQAKNKQTDKAIVVPFPITVNGQVIQNASEPYPLLLYRNITYFPITWRFGVDFFKWGYTFTQKNGLAIESTPNYMTNHTAYEKFLTLQLGVTTKQDLERVFNKQLQLYYDVPEHMDHSNDMYFFDRYYLKISKATGRLHSKSFYGSPPAYLVQNEADVTRYLSLENNMSYPQVNGILGGTGYLFEETPYDITYKWAYKRDTITATFTKSTTSAGEPVYLLSSKSLDMNRSPENFPELKADLLAYKNTNVTLENIEKLGEGFETINWEQEWKTFQQVTDILGEGYLASTEYVDNVPGPVSYIWVNEQTNLIVEFTFFNSSNHELVLYYPTFRELTLH